MYKPASSQLSGLRRIQRAMLLLAAFVMPVIVVGIVGLWSAHAALFQSATQPYVDPTLQSPAHDPTKRTVAVIASNQGTEISDFLAPFEVFATTGAFNVYAVAPERKFTPFLWGGLDLMPHYSFVELDQLLGKAPDVIVIPFFKDPENPVIVEWIRSHAGPETLIVSICAGADTLAATGLLDGGQVTTHQTYFGVLAKKYPHLELVRNVRYTDNGNTITSSGITGGIDASLHAIDKLLGKQAALDVATKLNYPHVRFLDDPLFQVPTPGMSEIAKWVNGGFYWNRQQIGAFLFEGVSEIALSAVLDTYGNTFTARAMTFAATREVIRSRHGLYLVPRVDFTTAGDFDRILVPGDGSAPVENLMVWVQNERRPSPETLYGTTVVAGATQPFAYDLTITDLARRSSEVDARTSLATLEYPAYHLQLGTRSWPLQRLASALLVGLTGLAVTWMLQQRGRTARRQPRASTVKPVAA